MALFAMMGQATSAKENENYPEGEIHSAMLFVSADSYENAQKLAISELEGAGWADVRFRKMGMVATESFSNPDPAIQAAFESAVTDGASIIIYQGADEAYAD